MNVLQIPRSDSIHVETLMKDTFDPNRFFFRGLHPRIYIGTASDRYSGWIGQIYSEERYRNRITTRTNKVGGKSFKEEVLPVECVAEYFQHFRVLEIDYTFYGLLRDDGGRPTRNFHVLRNYREYLKEGDRIILKVPQAIFAQKLRFGPKYVENPNYLNAEIFTRQFFDPAQELLGGNLAGVVFEQEYQRKGERVPPEDLAEALDLFFASIPRDRRYHVELRTESYLSEPVFEVFARYGLGQVLSHWTWLPSLGEQFARSGHRFFNAAGDLVIRLMTPMGMRYEDAYAKAHPFTKLVEGMLQPGMIHGTARLMRDGIERQARVNLIINNRAGGNAPLIAREIVRDFMEEQVRGN